MRFTGPITSIILVCIATLFSSSNFAAPTELRFERQWPRQDSAWSLNFPFEVSTDLDDNLYVVDTNNHRIQLYTSTGNFILTIGSEGSGAGQLSYPSDIAIGADSRVYILDNGNNRIQIFDKNGKWIKSIGHFGSGNAEFNLSKPGISRDGIISKPGAIAIDSISELLYVADAGNQRIQVFNTDGDYLYSLANGQLNQPSGLAVNIYTGDLYVSDTGNHHVLQIQLDRTIITWNWDFNQPQGIEFDALTGAVYLANITPTGSKILIFDSNGNFLNSYGYPLQFMRPTGLALNFNGSLFVADPTQTLVHRLNAASGVFSWYLGNSYPITWILNLSNEYPNDINTQQYVNYYKDLFNGYFYLPADAAVAKDGTVYVVDAGNHRIQWFDKDGNFQGKFGGLGTGNGTFIFPTSIAISSNEVLFIADTNNNRIQKISRNGTFLGTFGSGQLNSPYDLALSNSGKVYVADTKNNRIQVFTQDGNPILSWGSLGAGNSQFGSPTGIAVANDGSIYVGDTDNNRVQQFTAEGSFIRSFGHKGAGNGEFNAPSRITVAADNSIFVVDADNNRIQRFSAQGEYIQTLGSTGISEGYFISPSGSAIGPDNSIYVVDTINNRIQKFKPTEIKPAQNNITHPFKAIILAGGGSGNNPLWESTQILANRAYTTFRAQGFQKNEIQFLTSGNVQIDLDNNGNNSDDLSPATLQNLEAALTNWSSDAQDVVVYLIDHGGPGTFKVNGSEILSREQLGSWLHVLENKLPDQGKVTVIIESCKSGSFFTGLSATPQGKKRTLIASASSEQSALLSNKGLISFSYYFWSEVRGGAKLLDAFKTARQGMSAQEVIVEEKLQRQAAQLDANSDGQFNESDYVAVGNDCLGNCTTTAAGEPEIQSKTQDTTLNGEQEFTLNFQVKSLDPILSAWTTINRPDGKHQDVNQPISDLPSIEMDCSSQNNGLYNCQGKYSKFDTKGRYTMTFYAQDKNNLTSLPLSSLITQTAGKEAPVLSALATRYLAESGDVMLEDVLVNGQHFWAKLHDQGGFKFTLVDYHAADNLQSQAGQYDTNTKTLTIPKITAGGKYYRVVMQLSVNGLFEIKDIAGF